MNYAIFVYVLNPRYYLLHEPYCLCLAQSLVLDNVVKKLPSVSILHDQMDVSFCFNDLPYR